MPFVNILEGGFGPKALPVTQSSGLGGELKRQAIQRRWKAFAETSAR